MTERMDHAHEAVICLTDAADAGEIDEFALCDLALKAGQVHAALALVEQQRIANLIAYVAKWTDDEVLDVDAEIRERLGWEGRP